MRLRTPIEMLYIYTCVILTSLAGLLTTAENLPLWASIYDAIFIGYILIHVATAGFERRGLLIAICSAVYLSVNFALYYLYYGGYTSPLAAGEIRNFVYANKFIAYAALIGLSTEGSYIDRRHYSSVFYILLFAFTVKYTYARFLLGDSRPTLVTENNFELMLLLLLYFLKLIADRRSGLTSSFPILGVVIYVVVISGSRSSVLALACILAFEFIRLDVRTLMASLIALPAFIGGAWYVFVSRAENNAREQFFDVFQYEIKDFKFLNHAFGSMPLTPLSNYACDRLSFWINLMSSSNDGHCYSLILHSFFMRSYFDHGVFGILFVFVAVALCLSRGDLTRKDILGLISVPAVCGLSVSSFSSAFVSLPIAIICAWRFTARPVVAAGNEATDEPAPGVGIA